MIIKHGIPDHRFFAIALPLSVILPLIDANESGYKKPIHTLINPYTGEETFAEVHAVATLSLAEYISETIPSLLAYGISSNVIADELQRRYPEIKRTQQLRYVVFKRL